MVLHEIAFGAAIERARPLGGHSPVGQEETFTERPGKRCRIVIIDAEREADFGSLFMPNRATRPRLLENGSLHERRGKRGVTTLKHAEQDAAQEVLIRIQFPIWRETIPAAPVFTATVATAFSSCW